MNLKQLIDYIYYKPQSYSLDIMPYREYIFEIKLKNNELIEAKSYYLLSLSYRSFLEEYYRKGYVQVKEKQYPISEIEYTKLLKINTYHAYVWDAITDKIKLPKKAILEELIKRQKDYIPYAKYLKPKKLKKLINDSKIFYV